jgi:hypothetical protein
MTETWSFPIHERFEPDQLCDPTFGVHAEHAGHGCGRDPYERGAA